MEIKPKLKIRRNRIPIMSLQYVSHIEEIIRKNKIRSCLEFGESSFSYLFRRKTIKLVCYLPLPFLKPNTTSNKYRFFRKNGMVPIKPREQFDLAVISNEFSNSFNVLQPASINSNLVFIDGFPSKELVDVVFSHWNFVIHSDSNWILFIKPRMLRWN